MNTYQHTLKRPFHLEGIGLHTGESVRIRVLPAPPNTGIRFFRTDITPHIIIPARLDFVVDTSLSTVIGVNNIKIHTIEHLMAAFYGMNVDNAIVEVTGPEIPICDGSAEYFVRCIKESGIRQQNSPRIYIELLEEFSYFNNDKKIEASPCWDTEINCEISYNHPLISRQNLLFSYFNGDFFRIKDSRTFGFLSDVEKLRQMGLIKGGTLDNAIVLGDNGVINPDGLRYEDEFVRHKTLDIIGDMYLLGYPILAKLNTFKSGHQLHFEFARNLMNNTKIWRLTTLREQDASESMYCNLRLSYSLS